MSLRKTAGSDHLSNASERDMPMTGADTVYQYLGHTNKGSERCCILEFMPTIETVRGNLFEIEGTYKRHWLV